MSQSRPSSLSVARSFLRCSVSSRPWALLAVVLLAAPLAAVEPPSSSELRAKEYRHPGFGADTVLALPAELGASDAALTAQADLSALGLPADGGRIDLRSGRWATLTPSEPLVPGAGVGNALVWEDLVGAAPADEAALRSAIGSAFREYLVANAAALRIDAAEAAGIGYVTVHEGAALAQIYVPRVVAGVAVRGSYLTAAVNHGNLVLLSTVRWADVELSTVPRISAEEAWAEAQAHVEPLAIAGSWGKTELVLVPMGSGAAELSRLGRGYAHRLAWVVRPSFPNEDGRWEALIDAHDGELLSFEDTNHYATARRVEGGVYPVTNDGLFPDGIEQAGWPMPFDSVTTPGGPVTTDGGGNLPSPVTGNITSILSGQYVRMSDNCGAISLTSGADIDFGTSGGTDCTTPGFGGAGNTHASRTGFHELNRIKEMGRGQLPGNFWLQQQLTANMNINNTCNAFWNGSTVNFYRSGGGCFNTGEIAGVFDHEWGHGMDANDATPGIASPSGEGIADIYTALRLNDSCIGRNFRATVCTGNGDPCLTCTGVRDIDYLKRQSGQPHDYTWSNANCGGSVHCVGGVYSEAVWSLWKRMLQSTPYNLDNNTAHEIVNRLTYLGAGATGTWFSGGPPNGGCGGSSGYMNYLAADDDNGNLNDGTPHMAAIFAAFDDQEIACPTPAVQDAGCAGTPTAAPALTASPSDKSASLSWNAVSGASGYDIFRTDGVFACDFGKIKIGSTAGLTFNDAGLQNGRDYSYVVVPKGPSASCFGPASNCATTAPAAGPNLDLDAASALLAIQTGDGDEFLDNCETAELTFDVVNTGLGSLTNVRLVGVTPISHPGTTVTTSFPAAVSPSSLPEGTSGSGSFDFIAGGLAFDDTLTFQVDFTADELSLVKSENLSVSAAESDFVTYASKTFTFEADLEQWQLEQGTFARSSALGGGDTTTWALESSNALHNQCDRVRSPIMRLQSTATMSLWNNYDIEPQSASTWYDRANVGIVDAGNARTLVTPDAGRLYNADSSGPGNYTGCNEPEAGWAGANASWGTSAWSAAALQSGTFAGQPIRLEVVYATDAALANRGFSFDELTVTDVDFQEADAQPDVCGPALTLGDPSPGIAGVNNTWSITGATPGSRVFLFWGRFPGSTTVNVPGCPGLTLDMAPANFNGGKRADGAGNASIAKLVPGAASGITLRYQAVDKASCGKSNLISFTYP